MVSHIKEQYRLREFENRRMGNIFEQTWEEVTKDWSILHKEEFHDMCPSPRLFGGWSYGG
jgi:hypothetical protein